MRNQMTLAGNWLRTHKYMWVTLLVLLFIDRITKRLTVDFLAGQDIEILPCLHLTYVQNTGAAFGMMQGGNLIFIVIALLIIGYILKSWKELCAYGPLVKWGLILILAGALGNLYDRITLGFVVDFIDLRVWPVFNAADSFITVGGVLLACTLFFHPLPKKEEK